MAALQTLRTKAGAFISVCIGVGLLAFIMGDLLNSNSIFTSKDVVGKVDGEKIKYEQFQRKYEEQEELIKMNQGISLNDQQQNQLREEVWNSIVFDMIFNKVYENAGIEVTGEEVADMTYGNHISSQAHQMFGNPQTGEYDKEYVKNVLKSIVESKRSIAALSAADYKNMTPDQLAAIQQQQNIIFQWQHGEKELADARLSEKYLALIQKSVFCTDAQVKAELNRRSTNSNISVVSVRYSAIADSLVTVSESEIKAAYNKDKELYKVNDSRDIEYVSFPIKPTKEDDENTFKAVEELKSDFESDEVNAIAFAQKNAENPEPERFLSLSQLNPQIADFIKGAKVGEVFGPYRDGESYKISRFVSVTQRPDSVKASHILITTNEALADSLFDVAKKGAKFDELARKYSEDTGSAINGGDLDWFADGRMVPEFNEACFTGQKGDIVKIKSQYGTHIIKITDKGVNSTKYSVATIDKSIQYSDKTRQLVFGDASVFLVNTKTQDQFNTMVDSMNLVKRYAQNIRSNAQGFNAVRSARDVVKWAYNAEVGEISSMFECGDEFIVAVLVKKQEKGYANINDVSQTISRRIINDKKAEIIAASCNGKSLEDIASTYNTSVDSANINFASTTISGIGSEPALVGSAIVANQGELSSAVKGNNATYYFIVNDKSDNTIDENIIKSEYAQKFQTLNYEITNAIRNAADIEDYRVNFY